MGDEIEAGPEAMRTFATGTYEHYEALYGASGKMYAVDLAPDTFGYIPGIGQRIYQSYGEFVAGLHDSIKETADLVLTLGDTVRDAVEGYEETDEASSVTFQAVEK